MVNVSTTASVSALPYQEPDITTLFIYSSFFVLLNVLNSLFNRLLSCGLVAQILIGTLYGAPGRSWLSLEAQRVIVDIGYNGLILLVYEGGLSTDFKSLKANLWHATGVAVTGVATPIAISFVLNRLLGGDDSHVVTPLQAFAAGAALCSTSLGTTFAILKESGLVKTRLGVVLSSAAMMDDVVGLVMVQIISNLGQTFSATTVVRPIFVSIAFAVLIPAAAVFMIKPATMYTNDLRVKKSSMQLEKILCSSSFAFLIHTALLLGLVVGSSYAGTSNLFAAYIGGALISWWDSEVPHPSIHPGSLEEDRKHGDGAEVCTRSKAAIVMPKVTAACVTGGEAIFVRYLSQPLERILKPFFFASIGFSTPITQLFQGSTVWRGIVYTALMFISKMVCGVWLVRLSLRATRRSNLSADGKNDGGASVLQAGTAHREDDRPGRVITEEGSPSVNENRSVPVREEWQVVHSAPLKVSDKSDQIVAADNSKLEDYSEQPDSDMASLIIDSNSPKEPGEVKGTMNRSEDSSITIPTAQPPISLYPSLILGTAMTARGEIGFLIASLAQSQGVFSSTTSKVSTSSSTESDDSISQIFLVVTWAIMLCTILGPICVGALVRRVRKLQKSRDGDARDVLGVWGLSNS